MSFLFEILVRIAGYGPQIDQSHGENRLSHIVIIIIISMLFYTTSIDGSFYFVQGLKELPY